MTPDELAILVREQLDAFIEEIRQLLLPVAAKAEAECSCVAKSAEVDADFETVTDAMSAILGRVIAIEKTLVMKHSLPGQEGESGLRRKATVGDAILNSLHHPTNFSR